jgi:ATP-dependent helicase HepA
MKLVPGMKVKYLPQPEWGVGHLVQLHEEGTKAEVIFPARQGGAVLVSTRGNALVGHTLIPGDAVVGPKGRQGTVTGEEEGGRGLKRYTLKYADGEEDELPESELRAMPPKPDMLALLKEGRVADARAFTLRKQALLLDDERRCDALGALLASRVMVKPHQVGIVQRVLGARRPRFILADEVGLGKTIEAGMIFSALRLSGLANRVLVVTPSHLTVQWLAELFHKFNQLFTLMDSERHAQSLKERPEVSPWVRFDKVVTSLELLSRTESHLAGAAQKDAYWDLVIVDEAHHLKGEKAFEAVQALAKNSWGLLLLTATPMQLDPAEYRSLLSLIDPVLAPSEEAFRGRLARQEELSQAVRGLLEPKGKPQDAVKQLKERFSGDTRLAALEDKDELLAHLAETYSLSNQLLRNRRAVVGGFSERRLYRHAVALPKPEAEARAQALDALGKSDLRGAALANLVRRLESSPAAFHAAMRSVSALGDLKDGVALPERDAKLLAFLGVLKKVWENEPRAKVLVFTEAKDTLDMLRTQLGRDGIEALGYHGDLPLVDRDRQVARFRDPEGPKVLICTEVGGEGRNFQFAHHLVHYDLPWSPATVEQRIGRLDRIGQQSPVDIHVFDIEGTFSHDVLTLLADAVGVFTETVGGLDAVLEEVEPELTQLVLVSSAERAAYAKALKAKVTQAREQVKKAYDPLLDLKSFDRPAVEALVSRAQKRMRLEAEEDESLEDGLWGVARDLDERLEETVTELARRVGIGVDTDEDVDAFQCAFRFGHALNVEALPGLNVLEDKTVLGTFWRDTAVEQEEIEYFATGHSLVEALFGFLKDGPYGRSGARFLERRGPLKARGLELLYHLAPPEASDTAPGAKVPSRQLARFLDQSVVHVTVVLGPDGKPKVDGSLVAMLEGEGRSLKGHEVLSAFPELPRFVDQAVPVAQKAAQESMQKLSARAKKAIEAERDAVLERTERSLVHQGVDGAVVTAQLDAERAYYDSLFTALSELKVTLDSVGAFVLNR